MVGVQVISHVAEKEEAVVSVVWRSRLALAVFDGHEGWSSFCPQHTHTHKSLPPSICPALPQRHLLIVDQRSFLVVFADPLEGRLFSGVVVVWEAWRVRVGGWMLKDELSIRQQDADLMPLGQTDERARERARDFDRV